MGKSRSATLIIAYLMAEYHISPSQALLQLCEGRPVCSPNLGFMEQLYVYHRMLCAKDLGRREEVYSTWLANLFTGPSWEWDKKAKI
jgi:dual specificity phosphatase 12